MALKLVNRLYRDKYSAEWSSFFKGNTGDWKKIELTFDVETKIDYQIQKQLLFVSGSKLQNVDGAFWLTQGLNVGDSIIINYDTFWNGSFSFTTNETRNITSINGDTIGYDGVEIIPRDMDMMPGESQQSATDNYKTKNIWVSSDKRPQEVSFEWGLLSNTDFDNPNLASFIDGTKLVFEASGLETLGVGVATDLIQKGKQSGFLTEDETIQYVNSPQSGVYQYKVVFNVLNNSFFDSDINGLENNVFPEVLNLENCLTDNFNVSFYPENGNPNVFVKNDFQLTNQYGNTGWINENFNGKEDVFNIDSVVYKDNLGNVIDGFDYSQETVITAVIRGIGNLTVGSTKFGLGFLYLPKNDADFKILDTNFGKNLLLNTPRVESPLALVVNGGALDTATYLGYEKNGVRMDIKDIRFQIGSDPLTVEYTATFIPNTEFTTKFENSSVANRAFMTFVSCADHTLSYANTNRVTKPISIGLMTKTPIQFGSFAGMTNIFVPNHEDLVTNSSYTFVYLCPQDLFSSVISFQNDPANDVLINYIEFKIELINTVSGGRTILDSYLIDLANAPIDSNSFQQLDFNGSRGFQTTSDKNTVKVEVIDAVTHSYNATCGFLTRYEDWLENGKIPKEIFNATENENGLNNFWFWLNSQTDFSIKLVAEIGAKKGGEQGEFRNEFDLKLRDYNDNANINQTNRYYRLSDNQLVTDAILQKGVKVRYECDFELLDGRIWSDLNHTYCELQIQEENGNGFKTASVLSTTNNAPITSALEPLDGFKVMKIVLTTASKITMSCVIDGDKLPVKRYHLAPEIKGLTIEAPITFTRLNGIDEEIQLQDTSVFNFPKEDSFSFSCWVNVDNISQGNSEYIFKKLMLNSVIRGYFLSVKSGKVGLDIQVDSSLSGGSSTNTLPNNSFVNIVATYKYFTSSGVARPIINIYINGISEVILPSANIVLDVQTIESTGALPIIGQGLKVDIRHLAFFKSELTQSDATTINSRGYLTPDYSDITGVSYHSKLGQLDPPDEIGTNIATSINQDASNVITV